MKEIIIEVPDRFGQELKLEKVNSEIKGELVRCRDCKHCQRDSISRVCVLTGDLRYGNWYCADGERRTDNV